MDNKVIALCCLASLLSSCGYHFTPTTYEGDRVSISVPYIQGDPEATLNNQLTSTLARSGRFDCVQSGGDFMLQVVILSDTNSKIGYRFDRDDVTGRRRQNILGIENRRSLVTQVTLYDSHSGDVLFGPVAVTSQVDYDYVDPGSPRDLNTTTSSGTIPTIRYSYGQLDTVEGAHDDASPPMYQGLSQKIVDSIIHRIFSGDELGLLAD